MINATSATLIPYAAGLPDRVEIPNTELDRLSELLAVLQLDHDLLHLDLHHLPEVLPRQYHIELQRTLQTLKRLQAEIPPVDVRRLQDAIQNLQQVVADLEDNRCRLQRHSQRLQDQFATLQTRLDRVMDGFQAWRDVPVQVLYDQMLPRIHEWAAAYGKSVEVVTRGADLHLDREIANHLLPPALEIVHNSLKHGIEPPDERERVGKPPVGRLYLDALTEGDSVLLGVEDDGRGIDCRALLKQALERGALSRAQARRLSPTDQLHLVYLPGISLTSDAGRGLFDARSQLQQLRALIEIDSETGIGTSFIITVPRSPHTTTVLLVDVGHQRVGIPAEMVLEVMTLPANWIKKTTTGNVLTLDNRIIPLINLRRFWGFDDLPESTSLAIVMVGLGSKRTALVVDRWCQQRRVIVRPKSPFLRPLALVNSFGMLSSQEVIVLLDIPELIARSSLHD